jgi:hypothetical protein
VRIVNRANGKTEEVQPVENETNEWDDYAFPSGPADSAALKAKGYVVEDL